MRRKYPKYSDSVKLKNINVGYTTHGEHGTHGNILD